MEEWREGRETGMKGEGGKEWRREGGVWREGGKEGEREGERERGREGGREGREGGRE